MRFRKNIGEGKAIRITVQRGEQRVTVYADGPDRAIARFIYAVAELFGKSPLKLVTDIFWNTPEQIVAEEAKAVASESDSIV